MWEGSKTLGTGNTLRSDGASHKLQSNPEAQISFSFSGGLWPSSLPLFHGVACPSVFVVSFMNGSSVERKELHV
jgi:hypothetical protein